jgi:hypothetical protein
MDAGDSPELFESPHLENGSSSTFASEENEDLALCKMQDGSRSLSGIPGLC